MPDMESRRAVRGWVSGRVQGVAYRASFQREAVRLGVTGWVRNLADGRVEFLVSGTDTAVEALLGWARGGPTFARVDELYSEPSDELVPDGFEVRY
jgi:acylphosphatase